MFGAHGHAVEEERIDVVVQSLVIQEEFGEEAEVTTPGPLASAIDFEEGDVVVAVDFVARWMEEGAFFAVPAKLRVVAEVGEAEFADVDEVAVAEFGWIGREVPGLDLVITHLDALKIADAGDFGLVLGHTAAGAKLLDFFFAAVGAVLGAGFGCHGRFLHIDEVDVAVRIGVCQGGGFQVLGGDGDGRIEVLFPAMKRASSAAFGTEVDGLL